MVFLGDRLHVPDDLVGEEIVQKKRKTAPGGMGLFSYNPGRPL